MLLPPRFKLFSFQLVCVSAVDKCFIPSSVMLLPPRYKLFSLQLVRVSAVDKCSTPLSVILLYQRFKLFSLQLVRVSAVDKCSTPLSVMLLYARFKLFSLQLVRVNAVDKCSTPLSVILLPPRSKLFSLQLVCVSAVDKCFTPSSVMLLFPRFNLFSSQRPWLCSLPGNNFTISIHPSDWRLFSLKSKSKIPSTDLSACTNAKQSRGDRLQSQKSSALQPIFASFFWTSRSEALFSYMQLNSVTTNNLCSEAGQQVSVSVRSSESSFILISTSSVSVFEGRRSLKISVDCPSFSASSPATNCITTFHAPSWMWSETNFCRSSELYVSTKYFAAKNSCIVRCIKQYCSLLSAKGSSLVSGKRWNRPLLARLLTSADSKISFPSLIPSKAIFPRRVNSSCTEEDSFLNLSRKLFSALFTSLEWPWRK